MPTHKFFYNQKQLILNFNVGLIYKINYMFSILTSQKEIVDSNITRISVLSFLPQGNKLVQSNCLHMIYMCMC